MSRNCHGEYITHQIPIFPAAYTIHYEDISGLVNRNVSYQSDFVKDIMVHNILITEENNLYHFNVPTHITTGLSSITCYYILADPLDVMRMYIIRKCITLNIYTVDFNVNMSNRIVRNKLRVIYYNYKLPFIFGELKLLMQYLQNSTCTTRPNTKC